MEDLHIIRPDYTPTSKLYDFKKPEIPTGDTYYFTTDSGLKYQVRFGKKRENYLGNIINFSVLSDEFEDEYSETNRGEVYRIIATVIETFSRSSESMLDALKLVMNVLKQLPSMQKLSLHR